MISAIKKQRKCLNKDSKTYLTFREQNTKSIIAMKESLLCDKTRTARRFSQN